MTEVPPSATPAPETAVVETPVAPAVEPSPLAEFLAAAKAVEAGDDEQAIEDVEQAARDIAVEVRAVLAKYEHDIIGKAHFLYEEIKALV